MACATIPDLSPLFTPYKLGEREIRNRFVMSPMTRNLCPMGIPTEDMRAYYRSRARGGVGLIITEGVYINHPGANAEPDVPAFFGEECLDAWKRIVDDVHAEGCQIVPQLWHNGLIRRPGAEPDPSVPGYGPMEILEDGKIVVKQITRSDMEDIIAAYVEGAVYAEQLGFDGVQLHAAHEYLLDNFLWEKQNQRDDDYAGSLENRLRFPVEIAQAMRASISDDFPLWLRYSQWKMSDYNAKIAQDPAELAVILNAFSDAGIDIFDVSTRRFWDPAFAGCENTLAALTRKITGKPVMMVGGVGVERAFTVEALDGEVQPSYRRFKDMVEGLARDDFQLVGVGRALLSEPDWVRKVAAGRYDEIRPYTKASYKSLVI